MRGIRRGAGRPVFLRAAAESAPAAAAAAGPPVPVLRPAPPVCSHPATRAAPFFCAPRRGARFLPLSHKSFTEWRGPTFTFSENHAIIL